MNIPGLRAPLGVLSSGAYNILGLLARWGVRSSGAYSYPWPACALGRAQYRRVYSEVSKFGSLEIW